MDLTDQLIKQGYLETERIIKAFRKIKRKDFVTSGKEGWAEENRPLSIGHGQTISQPLVVAFMLELLKPEKGDKVLDIGSGSGWTTALLAQIVGEEGRVVGIEIIPELAEFGRENVSKYNFLKRGIAEIREGNGKKGYGKEAPFDKILVSAEAKEVAPAWKKQLKVGGRIAVPIRGSIWKFEKVASGKFSKEEYPGFAFVPLVDKR